MVFVSAADALPVFEVCDEVANAASPGIGGGDAGAGADSASRSCRPEGRAGDYYDPRFISLPVTVLDGEESDEEIFSGVAPRREIKVTLKTERSNKPEARARARPKRAAEVDLEEFRATVLEAAPRRVRLKRGAKVDDADVAMAAAFSAPCELGVVLCHLHGVIAAERSLPFSHGCKLTGKWVYALENLEAACAQAFQYEVVEEPRGTFALSGTFIDDPATYGQGCLRFDSMQLRLQPNSIAVVGEGHCDFYGPYTVTGELVINEQRTKALLRIAKLRPPPLSDEPAGARGEAGELDYDSDASYKLYCGPNCCCRKKQDDSVFDYDTDDCRE